MNTESTNALNTANAELAEIAALEKQIADRKQASLAKTAELRKETRVSYLNKAIRNAKDEVAEFTGVAASDWGTATKEQKEEIADFIDSLTEALNSDSPSTGGGKRGPRLDEDAMKARNEAIADTFRKDATITAKEVAAKFGVSEATVNIVKKSMGLVVSRKASGENKDRITVQPVKLGVETGTPSEVAS
jgi:DNA-binding XRE family transcriptional regulator